MKKYKMYDANWVFIRNVEAFSEFAAIDIAESEDIGHYYLVPVME